MTEIKVITIPGSKEDKTVTEKIKLIVEDRNKAIAKSLNSEELDVEVQIYASTEKLVSLVATADQRLGVFSGHVNFSKGIVLAHPNTVAPIFGEDIYKDFGVMIDYCLIKYYLCQRFYPEQSQYRLYYKYLTDILARIMTTYFNRKTVEFDIKMFSEFKKYTKAQEIFMALFVISEKKGIDLIMDNLDVLYEDCNIKKSIMKIYKKELKELIKISQEEMIKKERDLKKVR